MDLKPLITLLAIVNPLAIVPFFIHYTQGFSYAQRRRTIQTASLATFCVIAVCAVLGLQILEFFNISLQSFQVGGGLLGAFFELVCVGLGLGRLCVEHVHGADQQQHASAHLKALQ